MKVYKLSTSNTTKEKPQQGGAVTKRLTEEDLKKIYDSVALQNIQDDAYSTSSKDLVKSTYGEITYSSVEKLIDELKFTPNDIFYDLGSGNGKVVMQVFMNGNVKKAYGIEFYPERSYNSEYALKKLYKLHPQLLDENRLISYQIQNIKNVHYLGDGSVFFACSTCYPPELLDAIYDILKHSKNIRAIISHKAHDKFKDFLPKMKTTCFPCTWSQNLTWHIYYK